MSNQANESQLIQNKDVQLSFKFGFLGLGMGGSSIAAVAGDVKTATDYPYKSILVNSNQMDSDKITVNNKNTVKLVIGDGKGASRDIERGEEIFINNTDIITDKINIEFADRDFIWLVAGLGGGTGTGSLIQAIGVLMKNNFKGKFGIIITLPRNSEGKRAINNALERLERIQKAMHGLGSILIVDNEKLFEQFVEEKGNQSTRQYLEYTNKYVADSLHALNVVTASYKPFSEYHFDTSEFATLIQTPGVFQIARFSLQPARIDLKKPIDFLNFVQENLENGVLSDGYNLQRTKQYAISILANHIHADKVFNIELTKRMEQLMSEIAPLCNEQAIGQYVYNLQDVNNVFFYAAFSGLSLPERVRSLIQESKRIKEAQQQLDEETNDLFGDYSVIKEKEEKQEETFESLFLKKDEKSNNSSKDPDFDSLFNS